MNAAVIIGVSKYLAPGNDLPACKNDAKSINDIIRHSEKYSDILYINDNQTSSETKRLLTSFISALKGKAVEEMFFYYSGHGEFYKDEFYYILPDFDSKKRQQTTIQNGEIDSLFRALSPQLMVKVIDACQSGTSYIKANEVLDSYLKTTAQQSFKSCYFIYSSLNSQSSYSTSEISHFTASFIGAVKNHQGDGIRFKDIIDVIVDEFAHDGQQTPFFVIQGDLTERFVSINEKLTTYFSDASGQSESQQSELPKPLTLAELVKLDAKKYTNKEGALKTLNLLRAKIESLRLKSELRELYKIEAIFHEQYLGKPFKGPIAKWLKENPKEYFAKPIYVEGYDDEIGQNFTAFEGFDLKMEVPYKEIVIDVIGNYPNVISFCCSVLVFFSKRSIRFFYSINKYIDLDFEQKALETKGAQWLTTECEIADEAAVIGKIDEIRNKVEELIEADLNARFNPETDDLPF